MTTPVRNLLRKVRRSRITWRYFDNFAPLIAYRLSGSALPGGEAQRVLADLNSTGIAITSVGALIGANSLYPELKGTIDQYESELASEIRAARAAASDSSTEKSFNFSHVAGRHELCADDVFVRFALQQPIVSIANAYFGMFTHLRFINVWHTFATNSPARDSQLWHHDRDDSLILKMFVYLSDVDEGAGPVTYAPGTHPKGSIRREPRSRIERQGGPRRTDDSDMAEVVPPGRWIRATGPAGTLVLADTRGYHCGGRAQERDRIMYHCMFASSASGRPSVGFIRQTDNRSGQWDKEQSFALSD